MGLSQFCGFVLILCVVSLLIVLAIGAGALLLKNFFRFLIWIGRGTSEKAKIFVRDQLPECCRFHRHHCERHCPHNKRKTE